jgi:hypothetical protein
MQPPNMGLRDFLDEMGEVAGRRGMHLEVMDGHMVAVDNRPGSDPIPVTWDDDLKTYELAPPL